MKTVFDIKIDFQKSKGSYVYDKNSNAYFLDFFSMFASLPIGYNHEIFDEGFDEKVKHIAHLKMCNNLFASDELESFRDSILSVLPFNNIHFCSTGALAVESAIKCGYEYSKNKESIVVGTTNAYHGINAWGYITDPNISSVANRVVHYPRNEWKNIDLDLLPGFLSDNSKNVSSCLIEPIQCTAGDLYPDPSMLLEVQEVCKINNICFIVDEVQTGMGVTGEYWHSTNLGLDPDIIVFGKKSQISGLNVNDKYSEALKSPYRKLEVTFDGDLIDACRGLYILNAIKKFNLLDSVKRNSILFEKELSPLFLNYRSTGQLIAFDFSTEENRDSFVKKCYQQNILVNPTSSHSVRLRPNLAITEDELQDFLSRIKNMEIKK